MSGSVGPAASVRPSLPVRVLRIAVVGVVIVLALVTILTALRTELPRSPGVMSDALGPDPGEEISEYLDRAAASLAVGGDGTVGVAGGARENHDNDDDNAGHPRDPDAPRWALVTASQAWTVAEAGAAARQLPRVSGLVAQVPVEGVAMPVSEAVLAEPVAGEDSREPVFRRGLDRVADGLAAGASTSADPGASTPADGVDSGRAADTAALTASRIRAGDPAIIALLVRGSAAQLREVARRPGVRAVEALPPDAVWGRFAVRPLQPQQVETASPLPDSGPVPAR